MRALDSMLNPAKATEGEATSGHSLLAGDVYHQTVQSLDLKGSRCGRNGPLGWVERDAQAARTREGHVLPFRKGWGWKGSVCDS